MDYNAISDFVSNLGLIPIMELGEGGFGKAWMVLAEIGGTITVFKTISIGEFKRKTRPPIKSEQDLQKLLREVTVCHKLRRNPHIVQIYNCWIVGELRDVYEPILNHFDKDSKQKINCKDEDLFKSDSDGIPEISKEDKNTFLVIQMEYCDTDLAQWIKDNQVGSPKRTKETINEIFSHILEGLRYMHDNKVIHRDLKPSNIFLTICPMTFKIFCKIGDFGLARLVTENSEVLCSTRVGTPHYRSPEMDRLIIEPIDEKTDIFSAGLILLDLLHDYQNTNERISNFIDIQHAVISPKLINTLKQFPEHYNLLMKMFSKFPKDRPTAAECKFLLLPPSFNRKRALERKCASENTQLVLATAGTLQNNTVAVSSFIAPFKNLGQPKRMKIRPVCFGITPSVHNFVGRDNEISKLSQIFEENQLKYALVCGFGGIGKTELVKKFARNISVENHVTWLNGESNSNLISSIKDLAQHLKLSINNQEVFKILQNISNKLDGTRWLIVIDNVDEINELYKRVIEFTVTLTNIFVVVTSQSRSVLDENAELIEVDEFLPNDAVEFVRKSLNTKMSDTEIESFCKSLEFFPLALKQATAYIIHKQRLSLCGITYDILNYIEEFESLNLKIFDCQPGLTTEYGKTIHTTWHLTLDMLRRHNNDREPVTMKILSVLAFLDADDLPAEFLFKIYLLPYEFTEFTVEYSQCVNIFNSSVETLKNLSILKVDNKIISVHRIVQQLIQFQLTEEKTCEILETIVTKINMQDLNRKEIQQLQQVLRHIQKRPQLIQKHNNFPAKIASRLNDLSLHFVYLRFAETTYKMKMESVDYDIDIHPLMVDQKIANEKQKAGQYEEALQLYQILLKKLQRVFGKNHQVTTVTAYNLAFVFTQLKRYSESVEIFLDILQVQERKLRKSNKSATDLATRHHNVVTTLKQQVKHFETMEIYRQILRWRRKELGDNHKLTVNAKYNIAICLSDEGKYKEAIDIYHQVLEWETKTLGEHHKSAITTKLKLGSCYFEDVKYDRAMELFQQVLEWETKSLGDNHCSTVLTKVKVGECFFYQNKYLEGMEMHLQVLEWEKNHFGDDHKSTVTTKFIIGSVLFKQNKYEEALNMYKQVLEWEKNHLGDDHKSTVTTKSKLGLVFFKQNKYEEALDMYQQVLESERLELGDDHEFIFETKFNMGEVLFEQKKYEEAMEMYQQVLEWERLELGDDHESTVMTKLNMGLVLFEQKKYEEALDIYQQVLEWEKNHLGDDHKLTVTTKFRMGSVRFEQNKYEDALDIYQQVLEWRKNHLGDDHKLTVYTKSKLGLVFFKQNKYEEALDMYQQFLEWKKNELGDDHESTVLTKFEVGMVLFEQNKFEEAMAIHQQVLEWERHKLGDDHEWTVLTKFYVGLIFFEQAKYDEAISIFQEVLKYETKEQSIITKFKVGLCFLEQNKYKEAMDMFQEVLTWEKKELVHDHEYIVITQYNIGLCYFKQNNYNEALEIFKQVLDWKRSELGESHKSTVTPEFKAGKGSFDETKYNEALEMHQQVLYWRRRELDDSDEISIVTREMIQLSLNK